MKKIFRLRFPRITFLPLAVFLLFSCELADTGGLSGVSGSSSANFASGSVSSLDGNMAKGVIKSAQNSLGLFMKDGKTSGSLETARLLAGGSSVYGDAYLGVAQEDVFYYARMINKKKFDADNDADMDLGLLTLASRCKCLMTLYAKEVFLLVNTTNCPSVSSVDGLAGKTVNFGDTASDTYITASTIIGTWGITCTQKNDAVETGIANVVAGTYDAAFLVDTAPSSILSALKSTDPVKLIKVTMPSGSAYYSQTGSIGSDAYPFMTAPITENARV
jgi:TRAP-type uncharacterized transport system substrate-binding protein